MDKRATTFLIYDANCGTPGKYELSEVEALSRDRARAFHAFDTAVHFDYAAGELEPELRGYVAAAQVPPASDSVIIIERRREGGPC